MENKEENLDYLDIMTDQEQPKAPVKKTKKVIELYKKADDQETEVDGKSKQELADLLEKVFGDPEGPERESFKCVLDRKFERSEKNGIVLELFLIDVFVGDTKIRRVKKSLNDLRFLDVSLRKKVDHNLPSLAKLSKLPADQTFWKRPVW